GEGDGDGHPPLLRSQVRVGRGRRDLPRAERRALAARQAERHLLPRGRICEPTARRLRPAPGVVAQKRWLPPPRGPRSRSGLGCPRLTPTIVASALAVLGSRIVT